MDWRFLFFSFLFHSAHGRSRLAVDLSLAYMYIGYPIGGPGFLFCLYSRTERTGMVLEMELSLFISPRLSYLGHRTGNGEGEGMWLCVCNQFHGKLHPTSS